MKRFKIELSTEGNTEIINVASAVAEQLKDQTGEGIVHLFVVGSTAALTTIEYEPGLVKHDLKTALQRLIPDNITYEHEATWNDDNGHSHVRAALIGPSLTLPFANGRLLIGEYQQPVLIDLDTGPRRRIIIGTVIS